MSAKQGVLIPEAQNELNKLKLEVSSELGAKVPHTSLTGNCRHIPAQRCGDVGGNMVKKMVESFEKDLVK